MSKIKRYLANYLKKKKWYSILSDAIFVVLIALLIFPSTRTEVASFFIRLTSLPPSTLEVDEQKTVSAQSLTWNFKDMDGNSRTLKSLSDKPVFLNFWATWCPPCIAELPGIYELHKVYGDRVNFILVSTESIETVSGFALDKGFEQLPFYQNENVPREFASRSIPTTFIISKNGNIVLDKKGVAKWNSGTVEELLDELLAE